MIDLILNLQNLSLIVVRRRDREVCNVTIVLGASYSTCNKIRPPRIESTSSLQPGEFNIIDENIIAISRCIAPESQADGADGRRIKILSHKIPTIVIKVDALRPRIDDLPNKASIGRVFEEKIFPRIIHGASIVPKFYTEGVIL